MTATTTTTGRQPQLLVDDWMTRSPVTVTPGRALPVVAATRRRDRQDGADHG